MQVAWFPKTIDLMGNPYWMLLQQALEGQGVGFVQSHNSYWMQRSWLWRHRKTVQVLHFHFIQPQYAGNNQASWVRLSKFTSDLALARVLGYRIVWTLHDQMPTWALLPTEVEWAGRWLMTKMSHGIMTHCQMAADWLAQTFGRRQGVTVMAHPAYRLGEPIPTVEAKQRLGLDPSCFWFGFVGGIRPNKGIEDLIEAFGKAALPHSCLFIAGKPWMPASYVDQIRALAQQYPQISLRIEPLSDDLFNLFLGAADLLVFPFKQVLTSGSTTLALSMGKPVIVPRLGCLPETVGERAGIFYTSGDIDSLTCALQNGFQADLAQMGQAAYEQAQRTTWEQLAEATWQLYNPTKR